MALLHTVAKVFRLLQPKNEQAREWRSRRS